MADKSKALIAANALKVARKAHDRAGIGSFHLVTLIRLKNCETMFRNAIRGLCDDDIRECEEAARYVIPAETRLRPVALSR